MCDFGRPSRRRYGAGGLWLSLVCLAMLPSQAQAQEAPDRQEATGRFMLEAGLVGDNRCPGRYVGISGRVGGRVSLYGMVETYRCADNTGDVINHRLAGSHNQIGASVLLGRSSWLVRPALRAGIQYDGGGDVDPTAGASLTFGRRWGARFILHLAESERFQMGGYASF
ncbi:MAG: hypothetical protein OXL34_09275 [Gemmatimonadota bacterium]|nr:hypothetical protein [Gemmatimonadota bacterium]